ncbi:MAG: hypothetical protein KKH44_11950, partial [Bacteroidetes bacterium]|nr:hypothetical protein [Bacteroidota bacterium]
MIKTPIAVIEDWSGGQDTKTPIIKMGLNKSPNMRNWHCAGVKERLMIRDGYAKVNSSVVASDKLDVYYPPGYQTYDYALRDNVARTQISMGFKPGTSSTVTKVRLWLKKTGTPAGTDTITAVIQTNSSGIPSGVAVTNGTSDTVDISDILTTSYAWVTFTFSTNPTLVAGTQYHLVLQGAATIDGTNYVYWGADDYDVIYANGSMSYYDGVIWTTNTSYDACFEVYITGGAKGNDGFATWDFSSKNMLLGIFGTSFYKMDKGVAGTPDGTWDGINAIGDNELDYMEYTSDANAQAAYVGDGTDAADQQQTTETDGLYLGDFNDAEWRLTQSFQLSGNLLITAVEVKQYATNGTPAGNWTLRIETDNAGVPSGTLADTNASIVVAPPGNGNTVKGEFATHFSLLGATTYWIVIECDDQTTNNRWLLTRNNVGGYANGMLGYSSDGGSNWSTEAAQDFYFKVYVNSLQCYSEGTIKNQGSYSLKGIAAITDSLNATLTRTLGSTINLTGKTKIYFDIYA